MARIEPKHVAGSNNVKFTINPNNNYWVVLDYIFWNLYTYITMDGGVYRRIKAWTVAKHTHMNIPNYTQSNINLSLDAVQTFAFLNLITLMSTLKRQNFYNEA